ncbi:hypothetical protein BGX34_003833, partial [Mortierella sp. NVP85]
MGVDKLFTYLATKVPERGVDLHGVLLKFREVHIDLLSLVYPQIRKAVMADLRRKRTAAQDLRTLPYTIAAIIDSTFGDREKLFIHVDGHECAEKARARQTRNDRSATAAAKADGIIPATTAAKPPSPTAISTFREHLLNVYRVPFETKRWIANALIALGYNVCCCEFEADQCIARTLLACSQEDRQLKVAVTIDSDFLIYPSIKWILRPLTRNMKSWALYEKETVLKALGFEDEDKLVLFGVTSCNDYDVNIPRIGLDTNRGLIEALPSLAEGESRFEEYLGMYMQNFPCTSSDIFEKSIKIFHKIEPSIFENTNSPSQPTFMELRSRLRSVPRRIVQIERRRKQGKMPLRIIRKSKVNAYRPKIGSRAYGSQISPRKVKFDQPTKRKEPFPDTTATMFQVLSENLRPVKKKNPRKESKRSMDAKNAKKEQNEIRKKAREEKKATERSRTRVKDTIEPPKTTAKKKKRCFTEETIRHYSFSKRYWSRALKLGTVKVCLWKNQSTHQLSHDQSVRVQGTIRELMLMVNALQLRLYQATALLITKLTLPEANYGAGVLSPDHDAEALLRAITDSKGFMSSLACRLFSGNNSAPRGTNVSASRTAAYYAYRLFVSVTRLQPLSQTFRSLTCSALSFAVIPVYSSIQAHYENARFLSVDGDQSKSTISKFFVSNEVECRYKDFPMGKLSPSTVCMTEEGLLALLWNDSDIVQTALSQYHDEISKCQGLHIEEDDDDLQDDEAISEQQEDDENPELDQKLPSTLGYESFRRFIMYKKGILLRALFGTGNYQVSHVSEKDASGIVMRPTFQTNGIQITLLAHDTSRPRSRRKATTLSRNVLFEGAGCSQWDSEPQQGSSEPSKGKGKEEPLWDTEAQAAHDEPQADMAETDISAAEWDAIIDAFIDDPMVPMDWDNEDDDTDATLEPMHLHDAAFVFRDMPAAIRPDPYMTPIIAIDPGVRVAAHVVRIVHGGPTGTIVSKKITRAFLTKSDAWLRRRLENRKKAKGILEIESKIPHLSRRTIIQYLTYMLGNEQEHPPVLNPTHPEGKSSCRSHLEIASCVDDNEAQHGTPQDGEPETDQHPKCRLDILRDFYFSDDRQWYLRNIFDARRGKEAAMDLAIDVIFRMGGGASHLKGKSNFIIAIGNGKFKGHNEFSMHGPFINKLAKKAKALGILVVMVDEYNTSKKCPRPACEQTLIDDNATRSKFCPTCKIYFDRDMVGAEGIGRICLAHLVGGGRPEKYMRGKDAIDVDMEAGEKEGVKRTGDVIDAMEPPSKRPRHCGVCGSESHDRRTCPERTDKPVKRENRC